MARSLRPTFVLILLLALGVGGSARVGARDTTGAAPEALAVFDACWNQVRRHYFDPDLRGVDWLDVRARYRPRAALLQPGEELRRLLRAMVAELGTSHTTVLHPDVHRIIQAELANERPLTFGALIEETEPEFFFVRNLFEGGPAERAGVRRGDRIVLVDGVSCDRSARVVEAGYDPALPGPPLYWILPRGGRAVELVVQPAEDPASRRTVRLEPARMNGVDAARNSVRIGRGEGLRIGLLHIWFCSDGVADVMRDALAGPLQDCDALILDLRGRGGRPRVVTEILDMLRPRRRGGFQPRRPTPSVRWTRPVVFLVDERTRSAKEVLAHVAREDDLATVVGRRTEGAVLGARFYPLPDGSVVELPTTSFRTRGVVLEGRGVDPDVAVNPRLPFAAGRDPILELGLIVATEKINEARYVGTD